MTNFQTGHDAEKVAAEFLVAHGYEILELNWRTPVCEIDIVAKHKNTIYFVEVKYRSNSFQGTGLDYITPKKLKQMEFSAQCWVEAEKWSGDYRLSAIEVTSDFEVSDFIEDIVI